MPPNPAATEVLRAAVELIGGDIRPGQQQMVEAVSQALDNGEHLLVQAGTGTGKSLGYLVPVLAHLAEHSGERAVIATATLALQQQLAAKDIPAAMQAMTRAGGQLPGYAVLKGRSNYACLLKVRDGGPRQGALLDGADLMESSKSLGAESALGAEVMALREWAEQQLADDELADRDDAPSHTAKGWAQVCIPVRECLGLQNCHLAADCFVEKSRQRARQAQLIITNHALLAIDAMHGGTALPEHQIVVIDEAHELVSRMTSAATNDLNPGMVDRVYTRALPYLADDTALDLSDASDSLRQALDEASPGQVRDSGSAVIQAIEVVRDAARKVLTGLGSGGDPEKTQVSGAVQEVFDFAARMAKLESADVVWISESELLGRQIHVAPLSVAGLMRERVLADSTVVLTSATLSLGGSFEPMARSIGLGVDGQELPWSGIDVGSPFDYRRQGILYIAQQLPNPGRSGITDEVLGEIAELVWAAGGRTLGLFASRKAAETAALHVRRELPDMTVLCQGDAQLSELTRRFIADPKASLFGTVSLWQGVDVPGDTCQLVIIDKIPFPRPDDPLMQARQRAVAEAGGNGFMAVAATHAALLLAQGSGRLIRRLDDRGVVAVLDPRLAKARYSGFLRSSLPDFWVTTDLEVAIGSLRRLRSVADA